MRRVVRIVGRCFLVLLVSFLTLCAVNEVRQRVRVHRAAALLSDMHSLRLRESNWKDAQRLMTHWGQWGHYDGACTSEDCMYVITLQNPVFINSLPQWIPRAIYFFAFSRLLPRQWGGGLNQLEAMFLVQNGVIVRSGLQIMMAESPYAKGGCCGGSELIVSVLSRPSLGTPEPGQVHRIHHPDYIQGGPGGCSFCQMIRVTYADSMSPEEAAKLSDFQLSCATRWSSCLTLEELAPTATARYPYLPSENTHTKPTSIGCPLPIHTLGRDAYQIVPVAALEEGTSHKDPDLGELEGSHVKVLAPLKGKSPWPINSIQNVRLLSESPFAKSIHLVKNRLYLVMPGEMSVDRGRDRIFLSSCEILEENAATDQEIRRGMAMEDRLKGFEPSVSLNGFARHPPVPYGLF